MPEFVPENDLPANLVPESDLPEEPKGKTYANLAEKITKGPAKAGFMNLLASVAGLPVDTAQNVYNLGKAAVGTIMGRPQDFPLVEGTPGGSQSIKALLARSPYTSAENPNPESAVGTAAYDLASRGVGVPGMTLGGLSAYAAGKTLGPQYEPLAAMVPAATLKAYNDLTEASRQRAQVRNLERDKTLKDAQDLGLKTIPSKVNPSFAEGRMESFAGKAALKQQLAIDNQEVVTDVSKRVAGIPENAPLNEGTLKAAREQAAEPYRKIAAVSPTASNALDALGQFRLKAKLSWQHYMSGSGGPQAYFEAKDFESKAKQMETVIEREAVRKGLPDLVPDLRAARVQIAKIHEVEKAFNPGDGTVDARALGRAYDHGSPMTGDLRTIAKFALGPGAQVTQAGGKVPSPGVSALEATVAAGLGMGGIGLFGPGGAAAGALPYARPAIRALVASGPYQKFAATPDYSGFKVREMPATIQAAILANQQAQGKPNIPLSGILPRPIQDSVVPLSDVPGMFGVRG